MEAMTRNHGLKLFVVCGSETSTTSQESYRREGVYEEKGRVAARANRLHVFLVLCLLGNAQVASIGKAWDPVSSLRVTMAPNVMEYLLLWLAVRHFSFLTGEVTFLWLQMHC